MTDAADQKTLDDHVITAAAPSPTTSTKPDQDQQRRGCALV